ncbi:DNA polymerase-3 subunit chi [Novosphingobium capsulatum]|uniref:DNA polymerase-3 subunit chi n=1 Tax=Novosphingobium capsulatum TaxID=13688 RepID=A0ABU1MJB1_9SPHN|nr:MULTISPECIES: DNA polymerase III subunit chi [Novosphingobium]MBB3356554.1 DNA polymerase-3 subunit chi [Novosphingobium sp. BK256]MBB3372955.1 DNA polymerase-3 subunit chi [Novosphingobium sp. BK280]MBB3377323.1 DNA polymerase-3 subunit chi [Novosphingobium sp. BK258]MBB3419266.1 DNA polymerase-3 subunit chi [Novosphingobium sp. BK267]MBB3448917.1 DNA polymerase-3 subunit chi [Novosphingobium sp. BK352]
MRVDFYQLSRDPAELVLPLIARNTLGAGERLLVVSEDKGQLDRIGEALWTRLPDTFLANGQAGGPHDARQPILLSTTVSPANGAQFLALADGGWRESEAARVFLLFPPDRIDDARATWRLLGQREGVERKYWRQDGGKWREGP